MTSLRKYGGINSNTFEQVIESTGDFIIWKRLNLTLH